MKITKPILFTTLYTIKHEGINLTKQVEHAYTENYKLLLRKFKEILNKKIYHVYRPVIQ